MSTEEKEKRKKLESNFVRNSRLFFKRIGNEIEANLRKYIRSPTTIFFTILYPVVFILLLGSIFSGIEEPFTFELYVQNQDEGITFGPDTINFWNDTIKPVIDNLNNSEGDQLIDIKKIPLKDSENQSIIAGSYLDEQQGYICLVIPENFTLNVLAKIPINVTIIRVESIQSASIVSQILTSIFYDFNIGLNNETYKIQLDENNILVGEEISYVEYLLPGMIAITFMNNSLLSTITRFNYNRISGFFKKLSSSPMRRIDYVTSEMLWQFILSIFSMFVSILTAWLAFGIPWSVLNWMVVPIMFSGIMIFSGIGMIGSRLVKSPNAAGAIGNILTYPMMFLSGAFFDVSFIPALNIISKILPLTYVVDALRASMITRNMPIAWLNLGISLALAIVVMTIGILVTKWIDE